jgi:hypothetical protein
VARAITPGPVDVIVAHDAPSGVEIPGLGGGWPPAELYVADLHRQKVSEVVDVTRPTLYFHGHYHVRYEAQRGGTRVIGLADDGGRFTENVMVLDLNRWLRHAQAESPLSSAIRRVRDQGPTGAGAVAARRRERKSDNLTADLGGVASSICGLGAGEGSHRRRLARGAHQ